MMVFVPHQQDDMLIAKTQRNCDLVSLLLERIMNVTTASDNLKKKNFGDRSIRRKTTLKSNILIQ
jgi:transcription antitermination factor NusA-like protein